MSTFATLIKLAKKGSIDKLSQLIDDQNFNINEIDPKSGNGLIHIAIQNSDLQLFNVVVRRPGVDLQLVTKDRESPLQMAVRLNDVVFVSRLLDLHVNYRKKNAQGQTAFHIAIRNPTHSDIFKRLINNKFDINQPVQHYGSFLNLAIVAGQSQSFYFLIKELGIDYTKRLDEQGNNCLILAVKQNKGDYVVAILDKLEHDPLLTQIDKQFFINHQNNQGNTAIHEAVIKDFQTITQKLETVGKNLGIDLSIRNKKGFIIQQIKCNNQKLRVNEKELQKRRLEQRVVRKKEKIEEKARMKQQEERQLAEEKRRQEEQKIKTAIEAKIEAETRKKKTIWVIGILLLIALGGMYIALTNAIQKKKPVTL